MLAFLYLLSALLVGVLAIGQRGGFVLFFVLSLGLSPVVALLILVVAAPAVIGRDRRDDGDCRDLPPRRAR